MTLSNNNNNNNNCNCNYRLPGSIYGCHHYRSSQVVAMAATLTLTKKKKSCSLPSPTHMVTTRHSEIYR